MKVEDIKVVTVFGAGTMGCGIAQVFSQQGYRVFLGGVRQESLDAALDRINASLHKLEERGKIKKSGALEAISRIITTTDVKQAAKDADFVVEAIPEKLDLKKELFGQLDEICKEDSILATNTSTLSITQLASLTKKPEKFVGTHFMNPVPLMSLVEIITGLLTSEETAEVTIELTLKLGKEPIMVRDSPGFATGRLGLALYLEASRVLEEGTASMDDIDKGMRLGYGHKMGPFETCDLVGLDARLNSINALYESTRDSLWKPPQLLKKLVAAGFLGRKAGSRGGYYAYFGIEK